MVDQLHHDGADDPAESVQIDCGGCRMRALACGDCVVSVLLGAPPAAWDDEEQRALAVLADSGLVPPLRLVPGGADTPGRRTGGYRRRRSGTEG